MEPVEELNETIELDIDEENELLFKIQIEGADQPARVRLVCEGEDYSFIFDGSPTDERDVVQFLVPEMKGKITEGKFDSKIEVMIGNKFFVPCEFGINFKQETRVFAESIQVPERVQQKKPSLSVSAAPVIVAKKKKKQQEPTVRIQQPAKIQESPVKKQPTIANPGKKTQSNGDSLFSRYKAKSKKR